jgi:hypothetical protein
LNSKPVLNENDFKTISIEKVIRASFEDQNPVEDPSDENKLKKDAKIRLGPK